MLDDPINVGCMKRCCGRRPSRPDRVDAVKCFADLALRHLEFSKCDVCHALRSSSERIAPQGQPAFERAARWTRDEVANGSNRFHHSNARRMPCRSTHECVEAVVLGRTNLRQWKMFS